MDIEPIYRACHVPSFMLRLSDEWWNHDYFKYHHTDADTIDKVNPTYLTQNIQVLGIFAYLIADQPFRLPQDGQQRFNHDLQ